MIQFDVVINGNSLAGQTMALALAQSNLSVGIIDQKPPPKSIDLVTASKTRTIALSSNSIKIYQNLGLADQILQHGYAINEIHVSDQGHFGITRIRAQEQDFIALGYVIPMGTLSEIFCQKMLTYKKNITQIYNHTVTEAKKVDNGWQLTTEDLHSHLLTDIKTKVLIAADGSYSHLRQLLGIGHQEKDYQQTGIVAHLTLNRAHRGVAYERFFPDGAIACLPNEEKQVALVMSLNNCVLPNWQNLDKKAFLTKLQKTFGYRLGRFLDIENIQYYPLKKVISNFSHLKQFFLIGNASHTLHPMAAQSFNLAVRDINLLTKLIVENRENLTHTELNKQFSYLRKSDKSRTILLVDSLMYLFSRSAFSLPRNIIMSLLDATPRAKSLLGKYAAGSLGIIE